jgi:hypothetical protein
MKSKLENLLHSDFKHTHLFFQANAPASNLPWFHSFPHNSCEPSSSYLAKALEKRHPELEVSVVKGDDGTKGNHFWVEANEYVMDLTVDPFDESRPPTFGFAPHPSQKLFAELERMSAETAWVNLGTGCQVFLDSLLQSFLGSNQLFDQWD